MTRHLANGHEIDWEARGDGRPVVFLHGLTYDRAPLIEAFEPLLEGSSLRRIYLDLPGHGASRGDRARASADDLVDALASLVRELAPGGAAVVGWSYGGYLALGLARALGRLDGLFLITPVVEPDVARRRLRPRAVYAQGALMFFDEAERAAFHEVAVVQTPVQVEHFRRVIVPAQRACDREFLGALRERYAMARPFGETLRELQGPAAIVCGRDDAWVGWEDPAALVAIMPAAELRVVPRAGHLLPLEAPAALAAAFTDWRARL